MSKIWTFLIIIGCAYSLLFSSAEELGSVIVNSVNDAFSIFLKLALLILFWNGIFNIAIESGLIKNVKKILIKPLSFLFPDLDPKSEVMDFIASNIIANLLGLGAAATPLGLKAMEELQKINPNKEKASRSMVTFVLLNVSSLTLFPTTIISLRSLNGGATDMNLMLMMILTTVFSTFFVITIDRIICLFKKR